MGACFKRGINYILFLPNLVDELIVKVKEVDVENIAISKDGITIDTEQVMKHPEV